MAFEPIENYGVIGNMQSIALVGMNGSIDFLCYPDFDSPTVFAALLDDERGGRFEIRPRLTNVRVRQLYLPDTNILLTRFLAEEGVAELTDYMPIEKNGEQPNEIVRRVSVIRGNVHFNIELQRPLARNGSPLSFSFEAAHQPHTWFTDCGTDIFSTREYWRRAQLGLSLHVAARRDVHAVCPHSTGFCRRNRSIH